MKALIAVLMLTIGVGAVAWVVVIKYPNADIVVSGRQLFNFVDVSGLRKTSSAEVPKEAAPKSQPADARVREPQRASQRQGASSAQSVRSDSKPSAFEPWIKVQSSISPQPQVMGETNFPNGTNLMLILTRPDVQCADSIEVVVKGGKFHTTGICDDGRGLAPGNYSVVIVCEMYQPPNVRAVIGERGEHMTGPLVRSEAFGRNVFTFHGSIEVTNQKPQAKPADVASPDERSAIHEETARWQQVRKCAANHSHSGYEQESKEKLPGGWKRLTADGQRVQIMAENGDDLYLELRCIIRFKGVGINMAYVAVEDASGEHVLGSADHVLRFWCNSINNSGGRRVLFDDVTTYVPSRGREVSPNTLVGSIGFFACQRK